MAGVVFPYTQALGVDVHVNCVQCIGRGMFIFGGMTGSCKCGEWDMFYLKWD